MPYAVGIGYAIGYGFGDVIQHLVGRFERVVIATLALTLALVAVRVFRARRAALSG